MSVIRIHDDSGSRTYTIEDFPLQIGGQGADVAVAGNDSDPVATLGFADGAPFIRSEQAIRINGSQYEGACWLGDGVVAVLPQAHIVCRVRAGQVDIHVQSRAAAQTPAPTPTHDHVVVEPVAFHPGTHAGHSAGGIPWLQVGVAAMAIILTAIAWFMFTANSVNLVFSPEPTLVEIKGGLLKPKVGGRYLMRSGTYEVSAQLDGYKNLTESIEVGSASSQEFELLLVKLPGLLTVTTPPVKGATVLVDGTEVGVTPLIDAEVAPGIHSLRVVARNHLPYEQEIEVEGLGAKKALTVELQPNWAPVTITTSPPGAEVVVAETVLGTTPIVAEIESGEQQITLQLAGFKPVVEVITVQAGRAVELDPVKLEPADGIVKLVSSPAGASVTVDKAFQGRTPLSIQVSPDQEHRIVLSRPGYRTTARSITLRPAQESALQVNLQPILGSVRVVASPTDADVLVDGAVVDATDGVLSLTTAPHTIEIRKTGYASHVETITPREGSEQRISVVLKTIAEAQAAVLDPVITSVQGQTLRLMPTGSLQLGSARREQGRRSNEFRRDVELTREFYISETEVTNAQYREFLQSHNSGFFGGLSLEGDDQPVVRMGWQQAARYCNWLSEREGLPKAYVERDGRLVGRRPMTTGYRMPTESEWVWVARYAGGARATRYTWGDGLPPPAGVANLADNAARNLVAQRLDNYDDGYSATAPVGSFPPNSLGLRDIDGNVAEWMHDIYESSTDDPYLSMVDPLGPERGNRFVIRGASWKHGGIVELRGAFRDFGSGGREDLGFRLARYAR